MKREFSIIEELNSIRKRKKELSEKESELMKPQLEDLNMIPTIYKWFGEISSEKNCPPNMDCVTQRKKFLYVILFLYAPSVLAGGRLPNGVRTKLSELFKDVSPCVISNNIADLSFFFKRYKDFRRDIEELYTKISDRLV